MTPDVQLAVRELEALLRECEAEAKRHYAVYERYACNEPYAFGRYLEACDLGNTVQAALNRLQGRTVPLKPT